MLVRYSIIINNLLTVVIRVSRKDIFEADSKAAVDESIQTYESPIDIEIVEVDVKVDQSSEKGGADEQDEFDFPLFSFDAADQVDGLKDGSNDEGKSTGAGRLMRVSIREGMDKIPEQKRPEEYYFARYTEDDHQRFSKSAIDYGTAVKDALSGPYRGWARWRGGVTDLDAYNNKIESSLARQKALRKRRPGKKQRLAKTAGRKREEDRQEQAKEIRKMIKKRFHKRGGKKNKKKV